MLSIASDALLAAILLFFFGRAGLPLASIVGIAHLFYIQSSYLGHLPEVDAAVRAEFAAFTLWMFLIYLPAPSGWLDLARLAVLLGALFVMAGRMTPTLLKGGLQKHAVRTAFRI